MNLDHAKTVADRVRGIGVTLDSATLIVAASLIDEAIEQQLDGSGVVSREHFDATVHAMEKRALDAEETLNVAMKRAVDAEAEAQRPMRGRHE